MSDCFFRMNDLSVGYNGKPLISNVDLELNRGQILTLIGPNGSGKSTILKSISKHLKIISGSVEIEGKDMEEMTYKEMSTKIAVVLTTRPKVELMTCRDVVATGRYPYTGRLGILSKEDNIKVDAAIKLVNAEEVADRDFSAISDGQRQRVMLARAICQDPEIIILDEPTSFLDIKHKLELLDILRDMAENKNILVIMSLHEIDLAQKISDIILCVKGDHTAAIGSPSEIFTHDGIIELYDIKKGSYNEHFGSVEMPAPLGKPDIFIIAGGGTGVELFRELQKKKTPFYTGVLHTDDIDYQVAKDLAAGVVGCRPFKEISPEEYKAAELMMLSCSRVYYTGVEFGITNRMNKRLLDVAKTEGKILEGVEKINIITGG